MTLWWLLYFPMAGVCLLTGLGFLGRRWWVLDIVAHFRVQYLLILVGFSLVFAMGGRLLPALVAAGFTLLNLTLIARLYLPRQQKVLEGDPVYRLLIANILQRNSSFARVRSLVRETQPDFIFLVEANQVWLDALQELRQEYPYLCSQVRDDNYGVALFSRAPFKDAKVQYFGDAGVPSIVVHLQMDGQPLIIIGTHPPPPKGCIRSAYRNRQLRDLAAFVRLQDIPVILCGDLNMTPWSSYFHSLLKDSGLRDSMQGFGPQLTWPTGNLLFRIPIDHCLVSASVEIHQRKVGPFTGSDHFPVVVDFSVIA